MTTNTIAVSGFDGPKKGSYVLPEDYYLCEEERPISENQRKTIIGLIYARIDNPDEIERRCAEIESYNYIDANEAINDLLFAPLR
ncbi:MAG: hypothetical protein NUV47_03430 [Patescibacteria group bacterium]|nr:hypothetical protein [Patescibacteria group bacterium]